LSLSCYKAVVFLDIDGVLNSYRSVEAFGDYPHELNKELSLFDTVAVGLVRRLCIHASAGVVMSSTWRHQYGTGDFCEYLHLPVIGKTPRSIIGRGRGGEIEYWMKMNSCTYPYVIIDDEVSDMLPEQKDNIVHVCGEEGFSFKDYVQALQILKCVPKDGVARQSKYFPEVCGG